MNIKKPIDILIYGTGAVGSTLGWRLAQSQHARISVVCRSNYEAVKQRGLQMNTNMWGNGTLNPFRVARSTRELSGIPFDYVVCTNKVTNSDGHSLADELAHVVSTRTTLVSAQNGVGVEVPLRNAFQDNTVLSAVCYISCLQPIPGVVHQVSNIRPHAFHIGLYDTIERRQSAADLQRLKTFVALDDKFKEIEDVRAERWTKQIFNGAWNPMTAISGLETHQLLGSPYLQMVKKLAEETFDVAVRSGISLPTNLPDRTIQLARDNPSLAPSMLQDWRRKKPMEVDSLCGNVIRQAEMINVPVPTLRAVFHALLEMNNHIRESTQPLYAGNEHIYNQEVGARQLLCA